MAWIGLGSQCNHIYFNNTLCQQFLINDSLDLFKLYIILLLGIVYSNNTETKGERLPIRKAAHPKITVTMVSNLAYQVKDRSPIKSHEVIG